MGSLKILLVPTGIRAFEPWTQDITSNTRAHDLRRLEDSFKSDNKEHAMKYEQVTKLLEGYGKILDSHEAKFGEIKNLISRLTFQQSTFLQKLSLAVGESGVKQGQPRCFNGAIKGKRSVTSTGILTQM